MSFTEYYLILFLGIALSIPLILYIIENFDKWEKSFLESK